jgi:hypothetical protein
MTMSNGDRDSQRNRPVQARQSRVSPVLHTPLIRHFCRPALLGVHYRVGYACSSSTCVGMEQVLQRFSALFTVLASLVYRLYSSASSLRLYSCICVRLSICVSDEMIRTARQNDEHEVR